MAKAPREKSTAFGNFLEIKLLKKQGKRNLKITSKICSFE